MTADGPHCSRCEAPIRWAVTTNGKLQPLDREPNVEGNVVVTEELVFVAGRGVHPRSRVLTKAEREQGDLFAPELDRYMPHFASCPNAADFRRAKPKAAARER